MRTFLPLIAAFCMLAGCSDDGERVSEIELSALLADTTRIHFNTLRFKGSADLRPDKSAYLSVPGKGEDTGTWWLDGDTVCSRWKVALRGKTTCVFLTKFGDGSYAAHHPATGARLGRFQIGSP